MNIPEDQTLGSVMIGKLLTFEDQFEKLSVQLTHPDADIRRDAIGKLSGKKFSRLKSTPELLGVVALDDPDGLVRAEAVKSLSKFSEWENLLKTLEATSVDPSSEVRLETVRALQKQLNRKHLDCLISMVSSEKEPNVKSEALMAISDYNEKRATRILLDHLNDNNFRVRYACRNGLVSVTSVDFEYDSKAWKDWLDANSDLISR